MSALERFAIAVLALVLLVVGGTLGVRWYGAHQFEAGHAAAESEQRDRELVATVGRIQENAVEATKQQSINLTVTESKNEELAPVRARIAAAPGLRVGAALCGGATPAPEATSAPGGNGADSPGRVVRADIDRDIRALKIRVEEALGTGRACQAWAVANGMAPPQSLESSQTISAASSSGENTTPEK